MTEEKDRGSQLQPAAGKSTGDAEGLGLLPPSAFGWGPGNTHPHRLVYSEPDLCQEAPYTPVFAEPPGLQRNTSRPRLGA